MKQFLFSLLLGVVLLTSCDNAMIYGEDLDIKDHVWHKDSIFIFESDSLIDLPQVLKLVLLFEIQLIISTGIYGFLLR